MNSLPKFHTFSLPAHETDAYQNQKVPFRIRIRLELFSQFSLSVLWNIILYCLTNSKQVSNGMAILFSDIQSVHILFLSLHLENAIQLKSTLIITALIASLQILLAVTQTLR